jgi:hypothetical protein
VSGVRIGDVLGWRRRMRVLRMRIATGAVYVIGMT